jgi:hypothetical protein
MCRFIPKIVNSKALSGKNGNHERTTTQHVLHTLTHPYHFGRPNTVTSTHNSYDTPIVPVDDKMMAAIIHCAQQPSPSEEPAIAARYLMVGMRIDISSYLIDFRDKQLADIAVPSLVDTDVLDSAIQTASDEWVLVTKVALDNTQPRIIVSVENDNIPDVKLKLNSPVPVLATRDYAN